MAERKEVDLGEVKGLLRLIIEQRELDEEAVREHRVSESILPRMQDSIREYVGMERLAGVLLGLPDPMRTLDGLLEEIRASSQVVLDVAFQSPLPATGVRGYIVNMNEISDPESVWPGDR